MKGSVHSRGSRVSRGSKASYVDESLFGEVLISGNKKSGQRTNNAAIPLSQIRKIREETEKGTKVDGIVISQGELDRIRRSTKVTSKEAASDQAKMLAAQQDQKAAAMARKKRMQELDQQRAARAPKDKDPSE